MEQHEAEETHYRDYRGLRAVAEGLTASPCHRAMTEASDGSSTTDVAHRIGEHPRHALEQRYYREGCEASDRPRHLAAEKIGPDRTCIAVSAPREDAGKSRCQSCLERPPVNLIHRRLYFASAALKTFSATFEQNFEHPHGGNHRRATRCTEQCLRPTADHTYRCRVDRCDQRVGRVQRPAFGRCLRGRLRR